MCSFGEQSFLVEWWSFRYSDVTSPADSRLSYLIGLTLEEDFRYDFFSIYIVQVMFKKIYNNSHEFR